MAYDAGEAYLRVIPSFAGVVEKINREAARWGVSGGKEFARNWNQTVRRETNNAPLGPSREQSRRQGEQTGRTFADSFKARVDAALRSLPDIQINANSTDAEVRIARLRTNLEQLRDQRIGIDIDTATALATVENLRRQIEEVGRESPDVAVRVDTARAIAELDRIQADIDRLRAESPEVDVDVNDHGSAARTAGDLNLLHVAMIALAPAAIPLGAALVAAFAGALAVIGAVVAGIGVLTLGLSGVSKTVDLLGQRQQARDQAKDTNQLAQAERGLADARYNAAQQAISSAEAVKNARQSLADTERRVARQAVSDARAVADAQRNLAVAQQSVHLARVQAVRDLQDLQNAQIDANLGKRQAEIDLANAQANLQRVNHDWTATAAQRKQAQLDLDKAEQALAESKEKANRATADNTKAQKAGVSGAPAVVAALRQQRNAVEALRVARQKERQDAADGARQIARADQAVADALRNQQNQARASAEAILSAQDALNQATQGTASGVSKINDQLKHTSPAVLAFARFWRRTMSPIVADLKNSASSGLLPALERGLKTMKPLFAPLEQFIHRMAATIGRLFDQMATAFTSPFWTRFFAFLSRNLPRWLSEIGHVIGNIATGLAGVFEQFGPIINSIGRGLVSLTGKFADWGKSLGRNSAFQSFIRYVKDNLPIVVDFFGHLFTIAGKLITALAPLGHVMVVVFDKLSQFLAKLSPNQLLLLIGALGALVAALGGPVIAVIVAVTAGVALLVRNWDKVYAVLGPIIRVIKSVLLAVFDGLKKAIGFVTAAIRSHKSQFEALGNFIKKVIVPILSFLIKVFGTLVKFGFEVVGKAISFLITAFADLIQIIRDIVGAAQAVGRWFAGPFVDFFVNAWHAITGAFSAAWAWVKSTWSTVWNGVKQIVVAPIEAAVSFLVHVWDDITGAFSSAWNWVKHTWSAIWNGAKELVTAPIDAAGRLVSGAWHAITSAFSDAWHWVSNTFSTLWDGLKDVFYSPIKWFTDHISGWWDDITSGFTTALHALEGAVSTVWDNLKKIFGEPVYAIVHYVYNEGIRAVWNWVVGALGLDGAKIDWVPDSKIPHYSTGGVVPGYEPGRDTVPAMLSKGEGILRPEVVRDLGPETITRWNRNRAARFAEGGIVTDSPFGRPVYGFAGGVGQVLSDLNPTQIIDWVKDKVTGWVHALDRFTDNPVGKALAEIPAKLGGKIVSWLWNQVKGFLLDAPPPNLTSRQYGNRQTAADVMQRSYPAWWNTPINPDTQFPEQYTYLDFLWTRESNWDNYADTRRSGLDAPNAKIFAYGIAQARPATKYPLAGRPTDLGGGSDAETQIVWGLNYIAGRYGSPASAWGHELVYGWYDHGGVLEPGLTLAYNGTGRAEMVVAPDAMEQLATARASGAPVHIVGTLGFRSDALDPLGVFIDGRIEDNRAFHGAHQ
jgi:phage-related protein